MNVKKNTLAVILLCIGIVLVDTSTAMAHTTLYCQGNLYRDHSGTSLPNQALWCQVQAGPASAEGYRGDVDGVMGPNSWAGLQRYLHANYGYPGPIDGSPGINTYKAMQRWAKLFGYGGSVDGVMGPNSWRGFASGVRVNFFADVADPEPEPEPESDAASAADGVVDDK